MSFDDLPPTYDEFCSHAGGQPQFESPSNLPFNDAFGHSSSSTSLSSSSLTGIQPSAPAADLISDSDFSAPTADELLSGIQPSAPAADLISDSECSAPTAVELQRRCLMSEIQNLASTFAEKSDNFASKVIQLNDSKEALKTKKNFILYNMIAQKSALLEKIKSTFEENRNNLTSAHKSEKKSVVERLVALMKASDVCSHMNLNANRDYDAMSTPMLNNFHERIVKFTYDVQLLLSSEDYGEVDNRFQYEPTLMAELDDILKNACGKLQITLSEYSAATPIDDDVITFFDDVPTYLSHLEGREVIKTLNIANIVQQGSFDAKNPEDRARCHPISVDILDNLIVIPDKNNSCINLFSLNGQLVRSHTTNLKSPSYVAVDKLLKHIYVTDLFYKKVYVIDQFGELVAEYKGFASPRGIAFSDEFECLYVTDSQLKTIEVFDVKSQDKVMTISLQQFGHISKPTYVAVSKQGNIVVSDKGHKSIVFFDNSGNHIISKHHAKDPHGICFDNNGLLCIADYGKGNISMYNEPPIENFTLLPKDYGLVLPTDICFLPNGCIIITEYMSGLVKIFGM